MRAFFFIHVMKTAGTTFVRQLQQQFPAEAIYPTRGIDWTSPTDVDAYINIPRLLSISDDRRAQVQIYTGHFPFMVCDLIDPEPVALTVLREPVERTISVLKQFKRREARFRDWSLESIYEDRPIFRFFVENHQTKVFSLAPEDNEVAINCGLTVDDARFARARENLARVDVIGVTESYDAFVAEVRARYGWWPGGVDGDVRANVSTEDWDVEPAFRERIAADNAYDVELYEYAKALASKRSRS
jgi:hypothetical protein